MSKRSSPIEPKPAPMPDPDSLEMDDRGTRIYRGDKGQPMRRSRTHDGRDDGNYIGDPPNRDDTIRADDEYPEEEWLPASDAPTIIRDVQPGQ